MAAPYVAKQLLVRSCLHIYTESGHFETCKYVLKMSSISTLALWKL